MQTRAAVMRWLLSLLLLAGLGCGLAPHTRASDMSSVPMSAAGVAASSTYDDTVRTPARDVVAAALDCAAQLATAEATSSAATADIVVAGDDRPDPQQHDATVRYAHDRPAPSLAELCVLRT